MINSFCETVEIVIKNIVLKSTHIISENKKKFKFGHIFSEKQILIFVKRPTDYSESSAANVSHVKHITPMFNHYRWGVCLKYTYVLYRSWLNIINDRKYFLNP